MGELKMIIFKKSFFFILFLSLFCADIYSQIAPAKYYIQFTDKNNSPFTLSNPLAFLSQKALNRRANQGYLLDNKDLPVNPAYVDSVIAAGNVILLNKSKWLNGITISTSDSIALVNINALSFVQSVQAVAPVNSSKRNVHKFETDFKLMNADNFKNSQNSKTKSINTYDYGFSANQIEMIGLDFLHNQGFHGENMLIAVLDAGFYSVDTLSVFDSLRNDNRILGIRDFVDPTANVYEGHTHGMMVLSLMAGNIPGQLIGTSPEASFWLLRSEDAPTEYLIEEYNWVTAAEFADSIGADIINSSLGYSVFDDTLQNHTFSDLDGSTTIISRGANTAASRGILMVNSAGNSAQTPWQRIIAPADADSVLTIGAVDENGQYASFSSVGNTYDGRIKPDVASQGQNTVVASSQGGIMTGNGTSFSSPIIAGAVACLWQANPIATNMQIIDAIKQSASQYNNPDSLLGYGIPNFQMAHTLLENVTINENQKGCAFTVFPNPFRDVFSMTYFSSDTKPICVEIFNICGKNIFTSCNLEVNLGSNTFSFSNLMLFSKGIYFIKVTKENSINIRKLVKIS